MDTCIVKFGEVDYLTYVFIFYKIKRIFVMLIFCTILTFLCEPLICQDVEFLDKYVTLCNM